MIFNYLNKYFFFIKSIIYYKKMSNNYESVKVNGISEAKLKKLAKTGKISLSNADLMGDQMMFLHPMNAKLVRLAKSKNKGINSMQLTGGEIQYNMMHGGGIFDFLKKIGSTIYKAATSDTGKKILGVLADSAVPALTNAVGLPEGSAPVARDLLRNVTGVGLKEQRLMNLAKAREAKKNKGGSFRMNSGGSFLI